jgi:hypothetical protein
VWTGVLYFFVRSKPASRRVEQGSLLCCVLFPELNGRIDSASGRFFEFLKSGGFRPNDAINKSMLVISNASLLVLRARHEKKPAQWRVGLRCVKNKPGTMAELVNR